MMDNSGQLGQLIVTDLDDALLGEVLRDLFFPRHLRVGFGEFQAPENAVPTTPGEAEEIWKALDVGDPDWLRWAVANGHAYTWWVGGFSIDIVWVFGDMPIMSFRLRYGDDVLRWVYNDDWLKPHGWKARRAP